MQLLPMAPPLTALISAPVCGHHEDPRLGGAHHNPQRGCHRGGAGVRPCEHFPSESALPPPGDRAALAQTSTARGAAAGLIRDPKPMPRWSGPWAEWEANNPRGCTVTHKGSETEPPGDPAHSQSSHCSLRSPKVGTGAVLCVGGREGGRWTWSPTIRQKLGGRGSGRRWGWVNIYEST